MKTLIVYYSRTGTTRRLALALAATFRADISEIRCDRYRPGPLRYLRAGYESVRGDLPQIDLPELNYAGYDLVLLGAPIWTSYPALPLRAFLASNPDLPAKVGLFLTYGGHSPPEKAIGLVNDALPRPVAAVLTLKGNAMDDRSVREGVSGFLSELTGN